MIIYKDQLKELSVHMRKKFIKIAHVQLREKFPELTKNQNDELLNQRIEKAIDNATKYKIHKREDVINFLELIIFFGDDFDIRPPKPAIRKILLTGNFSGTEKMNRIAKYDLINKKTE